MCLAPKHLNLKVEAREAVRSEELKSHANSNRICAFKAQKDRGGCGARRMANIYCTLGSH